MIGVRSAIQQNHFRNRNDGLDIASVLAASRLRRNWNTLNQLSHHSACSIGRSGLYKTAPDGRGSVCGGVARSEPRP